MELEQINMSFWIFLLCSEKFSEYRNWCCNRHRSRSWLHRWPWNMLQG